MDRNIIMAIATVALIASVFIGISFFSKKTTPCPASDNIKIRTEQESYDIGESVLLSVVVPDELPEISTYEWSVEGKVISKQPTTEFIFDKSGVKEVQVTINKGCSYKKIIEIIDTIDAGSYAEEIEEGTISVSKKEACVMDWIQFNDNTEKASHWWWDFDDANTSAIQNPRHRYKTPGTYIIKRTLNGEETLTSTLTIEIKKCKQKSDSDSQITANFNITPTSIQVGQIVHFTDQTPKAKSWRWNFGDGYTSTERSPSHVYNYPGTRTITLSVNGTGKNITTKRITVVAAPSPPPPREGNNIKNNDNPPIIVKPAKEEEEMDLATTLKIKFQEIANSKDSELKTNIYYDDLLPRIADENMPVKIKKKNQEKKSKFFDYYNTLSIQGGQRITNVQIVNTDAEGRATELLITEQ